MSVTPIPQVMASLGLLERVAYEVQTQPETQSAAAQATIVHTLKQENSQVQKAAAGKKGQKIRPDEEKEQARQHMQQQTHNHKKQSTPTSRTNNPWSGNVLNVQI